MTNSRNIESVVLVGGGGHARSLVDVIESEGRFQIAGFVDSAAKEKSELLGYPWLGTDQDIPALAEKFPNFIIATGQIESSSVREKLFRLVQAARGHLPTLVSPSARCSRHSQIGEGTVILHQAVMNAGAWIGRNVIVNTGAIVEHDVRVEDHCHLSTGCRVNGGCMIGSRSFIGSGAVLKEGIHLAEGTIVGAGAVLLEKTEPFGVYVGVPARRIRDVPRLSAETES